jgi:hypothetical protein
MLVGSIPAIRNRVYEFFKIAHIFLAISFFGILFWHIKGEWYTVSEIIPLSSNANELSPRSGMFQLES